MKILNFDDRMIDSETLNTMFMFSSKNQRKVDNRLIRPNISKHTNVYAYPSI